MLMKRSWRLLRAELLGASGKGGLTWFFWGGEQVLLSQIFKGELA